MENTRNIILIGRTGNGKSTLANVISGTNKFTESSSSVSVTRSIQIEEFQDNITRDGSEIINYRVIDTIGIGDTQLTPREVLRRIQEGSEYIEKGLTQVLFVTNGRFTKEEKNAYNLLRSVIFDNEVIKYTTIIRTNFPEFEDEEVCERDRNLLRNENKENFDIIKAMKIIYVNNPPLKGRVSAIAVAEEARDLSRERLLTLLGTFQGVYKPRNLTEMSERISNYKTEKEKMEEELREKERLMKEQSEKFQERINNLNKEQDKKFEEFRGDYEKKAKEAQDRADQQTREAQNQGKLNEKLIQQIEANRKEAEERARREKEESEKRATAALKEKEENLRREAEDKRRISELQIKADYEEKLRLSDKRREEENQKLIAQIEQSNKTINLVRDDMNKNYVKKEKGGCE